MRTVTTLARFIAFGFVIVAVATGVAMVHAEGKSADHRLITPAEVSWKDGPPSLPPGAKVAMLEGSPAEAGLFTIRLKFPDAYRIAPHWHPAVERITVITGTFYFGMGETFDQAKAKTLPAGSFITMTPKMPHYASAEGETVVQLTGEGPWGVTYLNPADDPRHMKKSAR
jgi:quercetin dioxygenase-like cupin family protein